MAPSGCHSLLGPKAITVAGASSPAPLHKYNDCQNWRGSLHITLLEHSQSIGKHRGYSWHTAATVHCGYGYNTCKVTEGLFMAYGCNSLLWPKATIVLHRRMEHLSNLNSSNSSISSRSHVWGHWPHTIHGQWFRNSWQLWKVWSQGYIFHPYARTPD